MDKVIRGYWAGALLNDDFICIETYSGFRGGRLADPKGAQHFLAPDAGDEELGAAALDAMARSRFVLSRKEEGDWKYPDLTYDPELYNYELKILRYKERVQMIMEKYGYKTKKKMFSGMKNCSLEKKNGQITIEPSTHEKLEAWGGDGITKDDYVIIPAESSAAEVGAALRLAFSRCK